MSTLVLAVELARRNRDRVASAGRGEGATEATRAVRRTVTPAAFTWFAHTSAGAVRVRRWSDAVVAGVTPLVDRVVLGGHRYAAWID